MDRDQQARAPMLCEGCRRSRREQEYLGLLVTAGVASNARGGRRRAFVWAIVALAVVAGVLASGESSATAGSQEPVYTPPPEQSPFTSTDSFCTPSANRFENVEPSDPRLTASPITVVMLTPGPDPAETANPALRLGNPIDQAQAFGDLINKCGGIGGRKLDFHVLVQSGDPHADCLEATQHLHAFLVVAATASPSQSCIVNEQHTIMVTESAVSNGDLTGTQGRLVATGSTEGVLQARILDLIESGRLDGRHVAVVAGSAPADIAFARTAETLLTANNIPTVPRARADVLLVAGIDPAPTPASSTTSTRRTRHRAPLETYGFSDTNDDAIDRVRVTGGPEAAALLDTSGVYAFTPVDGLQARLGLDSGQFTTMCNKEYALNHGKGVATADLPQPSPPAASITPYVGVARVCLALRIVARGLFNVGVVPTQQTVLKAFHRLPYIEDELPDGTPKARPNQVINEPVSRAEQVVVLNKAEYPCKHPSLPRIAADYRVCWAPVSGWDDGGRAEHAPLLGWTGATPPASLGASAPSR